jgi:hypothetical protein
VSQKWDKTRKTQRYLPIESDKKIPLLISILGPCYNALNKWSVLKKLVYTRRNKFKLRGKNEDNQCQLSNAERQDALKFIRNGFFVVGLAGYMSD